MLRHPIFFPAAVPDIAAVPRLGRRGMRHVRCAVRTALGAGAPLLLAATPGRAAYRRVLVHLDLAAVHADAGLAATALALFPSAQFVLLHALDDAVASSSTALARQRLAAREQACRRMRQAVDALGPVRQLVSGVVRHGATDAVLCDYAGTMRADLLVVARGRLAACALILGLGGGILARRAPCDMLVFPA